MFSTWIAFALWRLQFLRTRHTLCRKSDRPTCSDQRRESALESTACRELHSSACTFTAATPVGDSLRKVACGLSNQTCTEQTNQNTIALQGLFSTKATVGLSEPAIFTMRHLFSPHRDTALHHAAPLRMRCTPVVCFCLHTRPQALM